MTISPKYSIEWEVRKIIGTLPKKKRTPRIRKDLIVETTVKPPQISSPPPLLTSQRKRRNTIIKKVDYKTSGHDKNSITKKEEPKNKAKKRKFNNGVCNNNKRHNRKVQILDGPAEAPPLPEETIEFIADKLGMYELQLLIQRKVFKSDIDRQQNRFSVPENSLKDLDFMSRREWAEVAERCKEEDNDDNCNNNNNNDGDDNGGNQKKMPIIGKKVLMVDTNLKIHFLDLKQWNLNSTISFMFTNKWSYVVEENQLKEGDFVQLWFFRDKELEPCFILVKLPP